MKIKNFLLFSIPFIIFCDFQQESKQKFVLINFDHLRHLTESVQTADGWNFDIVHIYAEYPDYERTAATGEGIACIDDAARVAVIYLRYFELSGDTVSLQRAKALLEFCRYMQTEDGQFYNFINKDYSINRTGRTSRKSFDPWAARAVWALGTGYRIFKEVDPLYADTLKMHLERSFGQIELMLQNYPETVAIAGFKIPQWLIHQNAADATAEMMLGLIDYVKVSGDSVVPGYLKKLADGLLKIQIQDTTSPAYGAFLSWQNIWHGWGNCQSQALAELYKIDPDQRYLNAVLRETNHFYKYWQTKGYPNSITFLKEDSVQIEHIQKYEQIAYAFRTVILGCLRAHEITSDPIFAERAAEIAAWFFGKNPASTRMYDPATGRCFDGINSENDVNRNSGAESTIEALYAIMEIEANRIAINRLNNSVRNE